MNKKRAIEKRRMDGKSLGQRTTWAIVCQIRDEYASGTTTQKKLGKKYGLGTSTVSDILNFKTWKTDPNG